MKVSGAAHLSIPALAVDALLEATVVGSFSKLGPELRSRTAHWEPLSSAHDKTVVVTGATSGLGLAMATELIKLGASVCLVGRDERRTESTRQLLQDAGPGELTTELCDLGDLEQVAELARHLNQRLPRIDVLIHNAGALRRNYHRGPQGAEWTLSVQVLAPFLLTRGLWDRLASSSGRVITMTSGGMYTQRFDLDTLEMDKRDYDGVVAYARAKRAQVVLNHEWQRRASDAITFHAVHPGWADTPGLSTGLPGFAKRLAPLLRSPDQGAETAVFLATAPARGPVGGHLWLDRRPRREYRLPWTWTPPKDRPAQGRELWSWCEERVALPESRWISPK